MQQTALRNMIGQMLICGFEGQELTIDNEIVPAITTHGLGGVILFDKNLLHKNSLKNIVNPTQVTILNKRLQQYAQQSDKDALPLFICVDYEGGAVNRLKAEYGFPETITAAEFAKLTTEQATIIAKQMADTLAETGFNVNFAPLVDLNINPDNPIIGKLGRSFGADALTVIKYATLVASELHNRNILFTYKHFPGHGSSTSDSHTDFVDITDTWQKDELLPYIESFNNSMPCPAIMVGHVVNKQLDPSGMPATLSYPILTKLLREELNYQGLIIADDMQMQAISRFFQPEEAMVKAINAGCDILIFGNQLAYTHSVNELIDIIYKNVINGNIAQQTIEQAFNRIKKVKGFIS